MEPQINYVAVLVAAIANFIFSALWYTPLFGKAWAKELGITASGPPPAGAFAKALIAGFVGQFLMAYVFAHNNMAWSFVPGMAEMPVAGKIISAAVFTWLGFYLPVDLDRVMWEGKSWKLFAINTGYHLGITLIGATILMLMM